MTGDDKYVRFTAEALGTQPSEPLSGPPTDAQAVIDAARLMSDMEFRRVALTEQGKYAISTVLRPEALLPLPPVNTSLSWVTDPYESALMYAGEVVRLWRYPDLASAEQGHVTLVKTLHAGPPYDWDSV